MKENVIEVNSVSKTFKVYQDKGYMLKEKIVQRKRNQYERKVILDDISFTVSKGEAIGLIGQNGCGKSTTLKLLTGIMYPDKGTINIKGRVSSLLELGAGFHSDLTGRENVYINASIFGLKRKEIDERLEEIIQFSELGEYIDNPVRTYSSGMYMKLAFSVAINVDADVLLIDEILAVGDVNFQAKCFKKLQSIKKKGTTLVIVSHDTGQIEKICDRCIWLQDGKIMANGFAKEVDFEYLSYMEQLRKNLAENEKNFKFGNINENFADDKGEWEAHVGSGEIRIKNVSCLNAKGYKADSLYYGEEFAISFDAIKVRDNDEDVWFGISIIRNDGTVCYGTNTLADSGLVYRVERKVNVKISYNDIRLMPGIYYIDVCIVKGHDEFVDYWQSARTIEIFGVRKDVGLVQLEHAWYIENKI